MKSCIVELNRYHSKNDCCLEVRFTFDLVEWRRQSERISEWAGGIRVLAFWFFFSQIADSTDPSHQFLRIARVPFTSSELVSVSCVVHTPVFQQYLTVFTGDGQHVYFSRVRNICEK